MLSCYNKEENKINNDNIDHFQDKEDGGEIKNDVAIIIIDKEAINVFAVFTDIWTG